jgi:hypothetical protein
MKRWCLALFVFVVAFAPGRVAAQTIDVLWYAYSPPGSETQYRESMQALADGAHTYAPGSGVRWRLKFFGPDDPAPDFSAYDVLVVASSSIAIFEDESANYQGIRDSRAAIAAARGSRTLITGTDPDFHYTFSNQADDGPRGLLVNFVNWAGSGAGLGIVALDSEDAQWIIGPESFLRDEVLGWSRGDCCGGKFIPAFAADYPINAGLTDAAFAGEETHTGFSLEMPGYVAIHQSLEEFDFRDPSTSPSGTTMVTASEAAGSTTPREEYWCENLLPPLHRPLTLPKFAWAKIPVRMRLLDERGERVGAGDLSQAPKLQVSFGSRMRTLGSFYYQRNSGVWTAFLDSRHVRERGVHTVEAVAGDDRYEVELCEQTITRR